MPFRNGFAARRGRLGARGGLVLQRDSRAPRHRTNECPHHDFADSIDRISALDAVALLREEADPAASRSPCATASTRTARARTARGQEVAAARRMACAKSSSSSSALTRFSMQRSMTFDRCGSNGTTGTDLVCGSLPHGLHTHTFCRHGFFQPERAEGTRRRGATQRAPGGREASASCVRVPPGLNLQAFHKQCRAAIRARPWVARAALAPPWRWPASASTAASATTSTATRARARDDHTSTGGNARHLLRVGRYVERHHRRAADEPAGGLGRCRRQAHQRSAARAAPHLDVGAVRVARSSASCARRENTCGDRVLTFAAPRARAAAGGLRAAARRALGDVGAGWRLDLLDF